MSTSVYRIGALVGGAFLAGGIAAAIQRRRRRPVSEGGAPLGGAPDPLPTLQPRDFQTDCDPTPKPCVEAFRDMVLEQYGGRSGGIYRDCDIGGKSEHKEGRAWDWFPPDKATGDRLVGDMLATDASGRAFAMARRWGLQYLIWWRRMWRAYPADAPGWHDYTITGNATLEHRDHVHFTFSRAAAACNGDFARNRNA